MASKRRFQILENWKVVLFSLAGATTFWLFNALNKDYSALITYPIQFEFDRDNTVILEPLPSHIKLDVSGGGWDLFRETILFFVEPIKFELDNPDEIRYLTRSMIYPLAVEHFDKLSINYLVTDTLKIVVERKMEKKVVMRIDSANIPLAAGFQIVSPVKVFPDTVLFTGPKSIISVLEDEYYISIGEAKIANNYNNQLSIPVPFEGYMSTVPSWVQVRFDVDKFEKEAVTVPVEVVNIPVSKQGTFIDPTIEISFLIRRSLKNQINPLDFSVIADYKKIVADSVLLPIITAYPDYVSDVSLKKQTVILQPKK